MVVPTRYLDIDGDALAYQAFGQGPDLTFVLGLSTHVDLRWTIPSVREMLETLGSSTRIISFDRRGTGASERLSTDRLPTWEDWADDLRHVLDAVGSTRTWLLATLDGGPYALIFAAAHPDRVHGLILANTAAKYIADPTFPEGVPEETAQTVLEAIEQGWGTESFAELVASTAPAEHAALALLQRASASPRSAMAQFRMTLDADFRDAAAAVRVPTVIFHRVEHPFVPLRLGCDLAARIRGLALRRAAGRPSPLRRPGSPRGNGRHRRAGHRHTTARECQPPAGGGHVHRHRRLDRTGRRGGRRALARRARPARLDLRPDGRGRTEVRSSSTPATACSPPSTDPASAVRTALDLRAALGESNVVIRIGIHAGEVEVRGDDLAGISVHIAQRIQG